MNRHKNNPDGTELPRQRSSSKEPVSFIPLPSWVMAAARCGFAIDPVLREAGVAVDGMGMHEISISHAQSRQLIEACVARSRVEHFPFVFGETFGFDTMPEIETFVATSSSLRQLLPVFDWVRKLMSPALRVTLHESTKLAELRIDLGNYKAWPLPTIYFTEAWIASVLRLLRGVIGLHQVERVHLRHAEPTYADACARHFGVEVRFGQSHNAIVLRREALDQSLFGALPELHRQAEARIEARVSKLAAIGGVSGQLERLFLDHPELLALSIDDSAEQLGMQVRTLQRRLHDENQRFADLQSRLRYRLACWLLRETGLNLDSISDRLGFSERRAFTRAFTRWAGVSPSVYRRSLDTTAAN